MSWIDEEKAYLVGILPSATYLSFLPALGLVWILSANVSLVAGVVLVVISARAWKKLIGIVESYIDAGPVPLRSEHLEMHRDTQKLYPWGVGLLACMSIGTSFVMNESLHGALFPKSHWEKYAVKDYERCEIAWAIYRQSKDELEQKSDLYRQYGYPENIVRVNDTIIQSLQRAAEKCEKNVELKYIEASRRLRQIEATRTLYM